MSTFKQLQDQVLDHQFNDTKYRPFVKMLLNEAQLRIARQADMRTQHRATEIGFTAGDDDSALPSDFARLIEVAEGASADTDWRILDEMGLREFDDLPVASGTPTRYIVVGALLYLYPTPEVDTTIVLSYWKLPEEMADDADEPELPPDYHFLLTYWALYRCFMRENDMEQAMIWKNEWQTELEKLKGELQHDTHDQPTQVRGLYDDGPYLDGNTWY
jgi:hypothetical protein